MNGTLHRLTAFSTEPNGGNPAGVWIGDALPTVADMQAIAADVGFSETAFVAPRSGLERTIRYYSPEAEVAFCGHATIATGVVLGTDNGEATYQLETSVGIVPVEVSKVDGQWRAALTSVAPKHEAASPELVSAALEALSWQAEELDASIPAAKAYGGAWHLVLAVSSKQRLEQLDYDFDTLKAIMLDESLTTLQLIWRQSERVFHSRNPFPVGGVVEDPATGAAAAALGGYLRDTGLINAPISVTIHQGVTMGRPSELAVDIPTSGGIVVSGHAVSL